MFQAWRRRRLLAQPEPQGLRAYLRQHLWQWSYLPDDVEEAAIAWLRIFVAEKYWEGSRGFQLQPHHQWIIAGQASLMTLAFPKWHFDGCKTLLIAPVLYTGESVTFMVNGQIGLHGQTTRLGQTSFRGPVLLNWPAVAEAAAGPNAGENLTIHELAHVLDYDNGPSADGVPPLPGNVNVKQWQAAFENQLQELRDWIAQGYNVMVSDYGLGSLTELLAVSSELFFQVPHELARYHPDLFELLLQCYQIDWREWLPP